MTPQPASRAVRIGRALATGLLAGALLFGALAVASIAVGLARDGDSLLYGDTLRVPLQLAPEDVGPLAPDVSPRGWTPVTLEIDDPTAQQMFLRSAQDLGPLALFIAGLWFLRRFLGSVLHGDPFGPPNVQRLRALGFILVVGAPLVELLNTGLRVSLYDELPAQPSIDLGVAGFSLPAGALLGGLGAFILAGVFAHGLRLREDVAGTV
jgi:Protein of unknown function (DUF2975)